MGASMRSTALPHQRGEDVVRRSAHRPRNGASLMASPNAPYRRSSRARPAGTAAASSRQARPNSRLNPSLGRSSTARSRTPGGSCHDRNPATSTPEPADSRYATGPCSSVTPGLWCSVMASRIVSVPAVDNPTVSATSRAARALVRVKSTR